MVSNQIDRVKELNIELTKTTVMYVLIHICSLPIYSLICLSIPFDFYSFPLSYGLGSIEQLHCKYKEHHQSNREVATRGWGYHSRQEILSYPSKLREEHSLLLIDQIIQWCFGFLLLSVGMHGICWSAW